MLLGRVHLVTRPSSFHRAIILFTVKVKNTSTYYPHFYSPTTMPFTCPTWPHRSPVEALLSTLSENNTPAPTVIGAALSKHSNSSYLDVSTDLDHTSLPNPPHSHIVVPSNWHGHFYHICARCEHSYTATTNMPPPIGFGPHIVPLQHCGFDKNTFLWSFTPELSHPPKRCDYKA